MWTRNDSLVFTAAFILAVVISISFVVLSGNGKAKNAQQRDYIVIAEKSEPLQPEEAVRRLPEALIIGVKKAGTRALLEYLRLHPDIRAPGPEIHFFDRYYSRGLDWYRMQMPPTLPGQLCLEKSPAYFIKKEVPERVYQMGFNTKLLVVVRDPVTRAISDYTQSHSKGKTTHTFEEMVFRDPERRLIDQHWSAVRIGIYERHLKKWLPYFPLHQIHFVSGENLISDPVKEMKLVEKFLGLRDYISADLFTFNQTKKFPCVKRHWNSTEFRCLGKTKGRTHPSVSSETLRILKNFYWSFNEDFFRFVGRNFGWNQKVSNEA